MSIESIKNVIHQSINELFATAIVDKMADDTVSFKKKLYTIAQVAEVLSINTEITEITFKLKSKENGQD